MDSACRLPKLVIRFQQVEQICVVHVEHLVDNAVSGFRVVVVDCLVELVAQHLLLSSWWGCR
eukprot:4232354-Heterocapsa_arctica.AAC.1